MKEYELHELVGVQPDDHYVDYMRYCMDDGSAQVESWADKETKSLDKAEHSASKPNYAHMPLEVLKYLNAQLEVGAEKGYGPNDWWEKAYPISIWWKAFLRHAIEFDSGGHGYSGNYTEYKPDGTPCKKVANHLDAMLMCLMRIRLSIAHGRTDEDDRPRRF